MAVEFIQQPGRLPGIEQQRATPYFPLAVVGGGPAGLAILASLDKAGALQRFLDTGVVLFDERRLGGSLHTYNINSNSQGRELLPSSGLLLRSALDASLVASLSVDHPVPLHQVGKIFNSFGEVVERVVEKSGTSAVIHEPVDHILYNGPQPGFRASNEPTTYTFIGRSGQILAVSNKLILANGAHEWARTPIDSPLVEKTIVAGDIIRATDAQIGVLWRNVLADPTKKIHVKAASHSSMSAVNQLLDYADRQGLIIPEGTIVIHHRDEVKIFYNTVADAQAAGESICDEKVCQRTGRYRRFGGLRNEAAERARQIRSGIEKRAIFDHATEDLSRVEYPDAALIIEGFGPTTNLIPIFDARTGELIEQKIDTAGNGHVQVDRQARLLIEDGNNGTPLPNAFGIGIGYGIRAPLEGERAHTGPVDGVNVYFEYSGPLIANQLIEGGKK